MMAATDADALADAIPEEEIAVTAVTETVTVTGMMAMTEEFRVDCALGNGTAVHRYIFGMAACAEPMNNLWKKLLAGSALAGDKHRQIDRSHTYGPLYGCGKRRSVANDAKLLLGLLCLSSECI